MGAFSRSKGQRGERGWRDELRSAGFDSERCSQYNGGHIDGADVSCSATINGKRLHFEVKRSERFNLYDAIGQAVMDCGDSIPIVAHRRNGFPWVVVLRSTDFMEILRAAADSKPPDV